MILDDASSPNPFSADPYIVQRRPRSILTLPLINQGKLISILYLENNLTPHVFTPDRITMLKVLASQAAISLENTRLYRDLEIREAKIRRLVDANTVSSFFFFFFFFLSSFFCDLSYLLSHFIISHSTTIIIIIIITISDYPTSLIMIHHHSSHYVSNQSIMTKITTKSTKKTKIPIKMQKNQN